MKIWTLKDLAILLVDDIPDMRASVRSMLVPLGANKVTEAKNGEEAIEALKRQTMDLVLCDYNLGKGRDGQQVLEEARALQLLAPKTIFVLLTAEDTTQMILGAVECAPDGYLVKPFQRATLETRIKKIQEKKTKTLEITTAIAAKRYEQALQLCDRQLETAGPATADILRLKGEVLLRLGEFAKAEQLYSLAIEDRDVPWCRLGLGRAQYGLKQFESSKSTLETLVAQNNLCVEGYDWLAKACRALGDTKACQDNISAAARISPKTVVRQRTLAEVAQENNDLQAAETAYKTLLKEGKHSCHRSPDDFGGLAKVYVEKGAAKDAVSLLGEMNKEFKEVDSSTQARLAAVETVVYQSTGDEQRSLAALNKAMEHFARDPNLLPASTALSLVEAACALGQNDMGEQLLKHVVRNSCDDVVMQQKVKHVCAKAGHAALFDVVESTRGEIIATNNEGVQYTKQGRFKEAIELFLNASRQMPENTTINLNVAMSCIVAMQKNGLEKRLSMLAQTYLSKVRETDPTNEQLKKMQDLLRRIEAQAEVPKAANS